MALYAIGDLHLSLGTNKPMDIFGGAWSGYMEKMNTGLSVLTADDTLILLGDHTWALDLAHAKEDFAYINAIPGRKILLKGNHDYWWSTASKFYAFCKENDFHDLYILNNNCYFYNDIAICGTRGWFFEEEKHTEHDAKILNRELIRLETSLKAAGDRQKLCFLHYPPRYHGYACPEIISLLQKYQVSDCFYGHLHADSHRLAVQGECDGFRYHMVSADYLHFQPYKVAD
ncbi:MAG: metallophosphoesterase [Clostridia bacterium]|nr:metallophosphoesterase [Clostridia bacterium]